MAENKSSKEKNAAGSKKQEDVRLRLRPVWGIAGAVVVIALLVLGMKACSGRRPQDDNTASIDIIDLNANVQSIEDTKAPEQTVVKIDLQSCKIVVGEKIYVTATVTPADTSKSLQWKSSDEKIFKVSNDGILEVTGIGTAALTATVGDVSDAIVIEGVESADAKSQMNLPGYNEAVNGTQGAENNTGSGAQGQEPHSGTQQEPESSQQQTPSQPSQTEPVTAPQQTTQPSVPEIPTTQAVESKGLRSSQLPEVLGSYGYRASNGNVYVYGEGNSYAGEIIIQPNLAIIYIKNETEEYSSSVRQVLSELLPEEHQQAWNNYKSATTDRTFTLEGRTVRIVTAAGGGHSQIVVYN